MNRMDRILLSALLDSFLAGKILIGKQQNNPVYPVYPC